MNNTTIFTKPAFFVFAVIFSFQFNTLNAADTWHVRPTGNDNNDGKSWIQSFKTLQKAIESAQAGDEIWVAKGTYLPTKEADGTTDDQRSFTFFMNKDLKLYGGFPDSGNPGMAQRDWEMYPTILSGDFNGDDNGFTNNGENAYSIVYTQFVSSAFLADGFYIQGGNANFPSGAGENPPRSGAGLYNYGVGNGNSSNPTIRYCHFKFNNSLNGGAVMNHGAFGGIASPEFFECTFENNSASAFGGGFFNNAVFSGTSSPTITNCDFQNNSASAGGALHNKGNSGTSSPTITNCDFQNNSASDGGALFNDGFFGTSSPTITDCSFQNNQASGIGGALYNGGSSGISSPTITDCDFQNNSASTGGALYNNGNSGTSSPIITDCSFQDNQATLEGGALYNNGNSGTSSPTIINSKFLNNQAVDGGALFNAGFLGTSSSTITNCSFQNNQATDNGGALFNAGFLGTSSSTITNCIFWNNHGNGKSMINDSATPQMNHCLIEESACPPGTTCGTGMIFNQDPLFNDPANGDLSLKECSPAIDAGDNNANNELIDLAGNTRKVNSLGAVIIDIGAYEYQNTIAGPTANCLTLTKELDANGNTITVNATEFDNSSSAVCGSLSFLINNMASLDFDCGDIGSSPVTLNVTDMYGQTNTCNTTITINDSVKPILNNCPSNISKSMDAGQCGATITWTTPTATDNCDMNPTVNQTQGDPSGSFFGSGVHTIKYKSTDNSNNESDECSFTITVSGDTEKPQITCPSNISKAMDVGQCGAVVTWTPPTATDNCDADPTETQTQGQSSGSLFGSGTHTIKYKATDISNNESDECSFTITVSGDTEKPQIACPTNISKSMDAGQCGAVVNWTIPTATDNCDANPTETQTQGDPSGSLFSEGTHTIEYKATDNSNNESDECSFTVTVSGDTEKPQITCPTNISKSMDAGQCGAVVTWTTPTATDNCDANPTETQTQGQSSGSLFGSGTHTIKYKATDNSNNESLECSFTITISGDTEKPQITCPSNIPKSMDAGQCGAVVTWTIPTATDNCDANPTETQTQGQSSGSLFSEGTHTIKYKATDNSNNESDECSFTVTVSGDTEKPQITCPNNISKAMDVGQCGAVVTWTTPTATDNCDANPTETQTQGQSSGSLFSEGTHTIKYKATDNSNNESLECSFTITISGDTEKPQITCPSNISKSMDAGQCGAVVTWTPPTATDNCDADPTETQTQGQSSGSLFSEGVHTIKYKATDDDGNDSDECSFTITISGDTEKPDAKCKNHTAQLDGNGNATISVNDIDNNSTDNCGIQIRTLDQTTFDCNDLGNHSVTLTVEDNNGNSDICTTTAALRTKN